MSIPTVNYQTFRDDLIARMADELDHLQPLPAFPPVTSHPLAAEARALLQLGLSLVVAPVPVSERPWEREGWCHPETGMCLIEQWCADDIYSITWKLQLPISEQEIEKGRHCTIKAVYPEGRVDNFLLMFGRSLPFNSTFLAVPIQP
jgi:hypothetical protein